MFSFSGWVACSTSSKIPTLRNSSCGEAPCAWGSLSRTGNQWTLHWLWILPFAGVAFSQGPVYCKPTQLTVHQTRGGRGTRTAGAAGLQYYYAVTVYRSWALHSANSPYGRGRMKCPQLLGVIGEARPAERGRGSERPQRSYRGGVVRLGSGDLPKCCSRV